MPLFIISIIVQVLLVLHVVKTGRNTTWIYIIVLLPMAGSIAYFIVEILPNLGTTRSGRQAQRKVSKLINPNRDINQAATDYSTNNSVENSIRLAKECINKKLYAEAKQLYQNCLSGLYEHDPDMLVGLAESEYGLENFQEVIVILDRLIAHNPQYKNSKTHLFYAKSLDKTSQS